MKLDSLVASLRHQARLLFLSGRRQRAILIVALLGLLAIPITLVSAGLDLKSMASYGYVGVFLATFLSSTTVIFPAPGLVVVVMAAAVFNPAWVAIAACAGGSLGEFTSYLVGYAGMAALGQQHWRRYQRAEEWFRRHAFVTLFAFALLPFLIFDLVGIAAGSLRYPFWKFLLATTAGRLPRSFVEAYLGWWILTSFFPFLT